MDFFSARLLFVWLNNDGKPRKKNLYDDSVVVFRAKDFDDALERAVKIGNQRFEDNPFQKFVEVVTLDWVGKKVDGKEVASKLHYRVSKKPISPKTKFHPEKSVPEGSF
jgi:hypothetical protein